MVLQGVRLRLERQMAKVQEIQRNQRQRWELMAENLSTRLGTDGYGHNR